MLLKLWLDAWPWRCLCAGSDNYTSSCHCLPPSHVSLEGDITGLMEYPRASYLLIGKAGRGGVGGGGYGGEVDGGCSGAGKAKFKWWWWW